VSADGLSVRDRLERARDLVAQAERALAGSPPRVSELHRAVDGAMQVSAALAGLVDVLIRHAPTALREYRDPYLLKDLVGDLRAVHGCLTNTPLLLKPARDDLGALTATAPERSTSSNAATSAEPVASSDSAAPVASLGSAGELADWDASEESGCPVGE
jgi:hypothetical protein